MAQVFNRGANSIAKASIAVAIVVAGVAGFVATRLDRSSWVTGQYLERPQPVQFSHKHHVGDDGVDCRYCHTSVETSSSAGMPPTQTCMNCHSQIWLESAYLEPVRASYRDNKPIKWEKVHDLPDYVYFNHSIHVAKGVGCSSCHGDVANMPGVYKENTLQMEWCLSCHKNPTPNLRPKSEIFNTSYDVGSQDSADQEKMAKDYKIRSRALMTSCSMCHR
jgi:Cytochrome c7 and related cytochrome c